MGRHHSWWLLSHPKFTRVSSIQSIRLSRTANRQHMQIGSQSLWKFNKKVCLKIAIPFVSTSAYGFLVQFPPHSSFWPFQTDHASKRNNYSIAQFTDAAIKNSAATFPSAAPFYPCYPAVLQRTLREAGVKYMVSSASDHADLKQVQALKTKKMAQNLQAKQSGRISRFHVSSRSGRKG